MFVRSVQWVVGWLAGLVRASFGCSPRRPQRAHLVVEELARLPVSERAAHRHHLRAVRGGVHAVSQASRRLVNAAGSMPSALERPCDRHARRSRRVRACTDRRTSSRSSGNDAMPCRSPLTPHAASRKPRRPPDTSQPELFLLYQKL